MEIIGGRCCATCSHHSKEDAQLFCRRNPPLPVPMIKIGPNGPFVAGIQSFFPPVAANWRCGEYHHSPVHAVAEITRGPVA